GLGPRLRIGRQCRVRRVRLFCDGCSLGSPGGGSLGWVVAGGPDLNGLQGSFVFLHRYFTLQLACREFWSGRWRFIHTSHEIDSAWQVRDPSATIVALWFWGRSHES